MSQCTEGNQADVSHGWPAHSASQRHPASAWRPFAHWGSLHFIFITFTSMLLTGQVLYIKYNLAPSSMCDLARLHAVSTLSSSRHQPHVVHVRANCDQHRPEYVWLKLHWTHGHRAYIICAGQVRPLLSGEVVTQSKYVWQKNGTEEYFSIVWIW